MHMINKFSIMAMGDKYWCKVSYMQWISEHVYNHGSIYDTVLNVSDEKLACSSTYHAFRSQEHSSGLRAHFLYLLLNKRRGRNSYRSNGVVIMQSKYAIDLTNFVQLVPSISILMSSKNCFIFTCNNT